MDGLDAMLENGLWFIQNNPLILKKWHPNENLLKEDVSIVPIWVKLHGVPVTAFSEDGLSVIATKLGAGEKKTVKKPSQTSRGVPVGLKIGFKPQKEYRPITKKPNASSSGNKKNGVVPTVEATSSGSSFMNIHNDGDFASNTPIGEKIDKIERQIGKGKFRLSDNDGNPLVPTGIIESDSEVDVIFDETANLRISTSGKDGSDKAFGRHLVEIYVIWTQLGKKTDKEEELRQFEEYINEIDDEFMHLSFMTMSKRSRRSTRDEFFQSINRDDFVVPQWVNLFQTNEPVYRELVREFFTSFDFKEYHSRTNLTFEGVSFMLRGETRTVLLLEFEWIVGLYDEEVASHEDTVKSLRSAVIVRKEEDWRPFWPTIARYLKKVRTMNVLCGGMFVTKIAISIGFLAGEMIKVLSVEPGTRVFPKKSLISMGIVMKLDGGGGELCLAYDQRGMPRALDGTAGRALGTHRELDDPAGPASELDVRSHRSPVSDLKSTKQNNVISKLPPPTNIKVRAVLGQKDGKTFIVNGHRLKLYHEEEDYNDQRKAVTPFFPKE
nr:hypothetical protein [Tanacetum cinerariifolium]